MKKKNMVVAEAIPTEIQQKAQPVKKNRIILLSFILVFAILLLVIVIVPFYTNAKMTGESIGSKVYTYKKQQIL